MSQKTQVVVADGVMAANVLRNDDVGRWLNVVVAVTQRCMTGIIVRIARSLSLAFAV
jgi:hypothetical protein